jgi:hypothetical protein
MGHLAGKEVYRELGRKIDGLAARAPWSDSLRAILEELYTQEEALLVASMPWGFSTLKRLERITGLPRVVLDAASRKPVPARIGPGPVHSRQVLLHAVAAGDRDF